MTELQFRIAIAFAITLISAALFASDYWRHEEAMAKIERGCKP